METHVPGPGPLERRTVLQLLPTPGLDAAARVARSLAEVPPEEPWQVRIAHLWEPRDAAPSILEESRPLNEPVPRNSLASFLAPWRDWKVGSFDVLHTHLFRPAFVARFSRRGRSRGAIWVHTEHNLGPRTGLSATLVGRFLHRLALRSADALVAVAPPVHQRLQQLYPDRRCVLVPNGVPGPPEVPRLPGLASPFVTLGFLGRLAPEKGILELLEAFRELPYDDCRLLVAGDGPLRGAVQNALDEPSLARQVRYVGYVSDLSSFFTEIDALIMPSRTEGLPLALLEALAHGRPVVATLVGGIPVALPEEFLRFHIASPEPPSIRAAVDAFLSARSDLPALGAAAVARWRSHYTVDHMIAAHLALYDRLLARATAS